jgi:hypothetical protein
MLLPHKLIERPRPHPHGQGCIGSYSLSWSLLFAVE